MKKRFALSTNLLTLALVCGTSYSAYGQSTSKLVTPPSGYSFNDITITENPDPNAKQLRESEEKIARLKMKLQEATSLQDEKIISDVKGEVRSALSEHFDREHVLQESELTRLSKRADIVESQNNQRKSARDEIIDLQLQSYLLEKEAPGLELKNSEVQSLLKLGRIDEAKRSMGVGETPDATTSPANTLLNAPGSGDGVSARGAQRPATVPAPKATSTIPAPKATSTFGGRTNPNRLQNVSNNLNLKEMIDNARTKLVGAASTDEEALATQELKDALAVYFDRDLEERERTLKIVRDDLEKMKQKLEKRANSKNAIVELHFKMFVNEASGLGFFSPSVNESKKLFGR